MKKLIDDWEFNVFGIYNYKKKGRFDKIISFIKEKHDLIPGDIIEAGVYKGSSLLSIGMLLKELGSSKKIYGFDSFSGFPPIYSKEDHINEFENMATNGLINTNHIDAVRRNLAYISELKNIDNYEKETALSTSGNFSGTSFDLLKKKIDIIGLDNIVLVEGAFSDSMKDDLPPQNIMAAIIDCDLYQSYVESFNFIWPRLSTGGIIHLDEYYSLKFPGARKATDEFVNENKNAILKMADIEIGEFERWYLYKSL